MLEGTFALLCFFLGLAFVLGLIAKTLFASFFSHDAAREQRPRSPQPRDSLTCSHCGATLSRHEERCPFCGVDHDPKRAEELRDLEATARTIQRLVERGALSSELSEQVYARVEARQHELIDREPPRFDTTAQFTVGQLESWFSSDPGTWSIDDKRNALTIARTLTAGVLRDLSARALVAIAALLASTGLSSRACRVYRILVDCHPSAALTENAAATALELACRMEAWDDAEAFVAALERTPTPSARTPTVMSLMRKVQARHEAKPAPGSRLEEIPVAAPARSVAKTPAIAAPTEPAPAPEPPASRRSFTEWIAVFMEERNILWGELLGGTLFVGCSIALVVSLWHKFAEIEFFPFFLFAVITGVVFAAGFYTLHHWKLEATSRGLLFIGALLTPLTFSVLAGLIQGNLAEAGTVGVWHIVLGAAAMLGFGWLFWRAARILVAAPLEIDVPSAGWMAIAMLIGALAQLVAPFAMHAVRWHAASEYSLGVFPPISYLLAMGAILIALHPRPTWTRPQLAALSIALAIAGFACAIPLGSVLFVSEDTHATLLHLTPTLTLFGIPILWTGLAMTRKLAPRASASETGAGSGLWNTFASGLTLLGIFAMAAGFAIAFGDVAHRWICGLLSVTVLSAFAWTLRSPLMLIPMQLALGLLFVAGTSHDFDVLREAPAVSMRLCLLMVMQTVAAEVCVRRDRRGEAFLLILGGAVSTGLALVTGLHVAADMPEVAALVFGVGGATWLAANARWMRASVTYVSAALMAGAIFFACRGRVDIDLPEQILWSLLTHASLACGGAALVRCSSSEDVRRAFREPLQWASLASTIAVAGVVIIEQAHGMSAWTTTFACGWIAALWLTLAILEGWPILFASFQVALVLAWLFGAGAQLTELEWDPFEPYSLHGYGVGLAFYCLVFEIVRRFPRTHPLLMPAFIPVDRAIAGALVVGQWLLAAFIILRGVGNELFDVPDLWQTMPLDYYEHAHSPWPWFMLVVLSAVMVRWLRHFDIGIGLMGIAVLALTAPILLAGAAFDQTNSAASALRWGLPLVYAVGSLLLWQRNQLRAAEAPALKLRAIFIAGAVVPTLAITLIVVARKLAGAPFGGPVGGIFSEFPRAVSLLVPLGFITATLAGHGFRERLAPYLSAAGLLACLGSVGGFLLVLQRNEIAFAQTWVMVDSLLIAAGVAALWRIVWITVANIIDNDAKPLLDSPLVQIQDTLGKALFLVVLLPAVGWIAVRDPDVAHSWALATGEPWSWIVAVILASSAWVHSWIHRQSIALEWFGKLTLLFVALAACSVELIAPSNGTIVLMFGMGVAACVWACVHGFLDAHHPAAWLRCDRAGRDSLLFAVAPAIVATLLGGGTLVTGDHRIWGAESVLLSAAACALVAYRRRTEVWSTLATGLTMLAGTIVVAHFEPVELGSRLLQVNLAIGGAAALVRLAWRHVLAPSQEAQPQLAILILLGLAGNAVLTALALGELAFDPAHAGPWLRQMGDAATWPALAFNVVAAVWFLSIVQPRRVVHAVVFGGLMAGVTLAGAVAAPFEAAWLGHHVLTLAWTLLAVGVMVVSWVSHAHDALGPQFWPAERRERVASFLRERFSEWITRSLVTACGACVVLLALREVTVEPARPYWSIANTLAVGVLLALLAVWSRAAGFLYGSGLMINIIGLLIFTAWSTHRVNDPGPILGLHEQISVGVLAQILSFGIGAMLASLLERRMFAQRVRLTGVFELPYAQAALLLGVQLLAIGVGVANGLHLQGEHVHIALRLAWLALGVLVVAAGFELWRPGFERVSRYLLYTCGLTAIGLVLHGLALPVHDWLRIAMLLLAGYGLAIALFLRFAWSVPVVARMLRLPRTPSRGFVDVQYGLMAVIVAVSLWIALTGGTLAERLAAPGCCVLAAVSAGLLRSAWRDTGRHVVIALGIGAALEVGWACLEPTLPAIWLQRGGVTLSVLVAALFACRFSVVRDADWADVLRRASAVLGVMAIALLVLLLGHELSAYNPAQDVRTTPMLKGITVLAGFAITALTGLALWSAATKQGDVYGLEDQRRSLYVYLTELLVLALLAHVRLNLPDLIPPILGKFWFLSVMVLAFVGVAVSEACDRRNLPVFATPLRHGAWILAFVPVLAFALSRFVGHPAWLAAKLPGLEPFFQYLTYLAGQFLWESCCWLLLALFFAWHARLRRSANFGVVAALALNFGLWVLFAHQDATAFLERPQLWLIPLGVIILVAEHINRERLGFGASLAVRYVGLATIYLSSTIEMFKEGLGTNPIFPIVLALLAVLGALAGILLRIKAFVLSGFVALVVVVLTQIWHAAIGQTWVWWASGIVLGGLILTMFAIFEKHRDHVLRMMDQVKRWD